MAIEKDLLDQLLAGRDPKDVFNKDGLVDELKKALSERILNTELDDHLDGDGVEGKTNYRNGYSKKSVLTGPSKMTLSVPRDRAGTFDPKLIAKYQRRFPEFDDKIISMYARGMTVREIRGHLEELYGIEVSPDLVSAITDAVLDEVAEWQNRPLDICYPLVFFDAIRVKVRDEGFVRNKAIYIALGILPDGTKEILGIWIEPPGRIARTSRRRCGPSIARPTPRSARPPSTPSHKVRGARSIRRSRRAGAATGTWSFRSSRFPKASAKSSTPRTPSRR